MESVLFRNICNEIMRECHNKHIKAKRNFITYYVKLLLIDPKWNITLESEEINRLDLQVIVKSAVSFLSNEFNPALVTLQLQQLFDSSFDTFSNLVREHELYLSKKLYPLKKEIMAVQSLEEEEDYENFFRKIVMYLTLSHGLGNPSKKPVYNEAKAALRSIFWIHEMKDFIKSEYKETELQSIANLLMGIRLFNRDRKRSGVGIEDLPSLLVDAIDIINHELKNNLSNTMENVNLLTTALDMCYQVEEVAGKNVLSCILPPNITQLDIESIKDLLICFRQNEIYIRQLTAEIAEIEDKIHYIFENFQSCLEETHKTVHFKIAIAAAEVYPHFADVAFGWHRMQDQAIYLSKLRQISTNLETYVLQASKHDKAVNEIIENRSVLADGERLRYFSRQIPEVECNTDNFIGPSEISDFEQTGAQYLGFCAWKLVESQGALLPGNPDLGLVQHQNKYYVFSCLEGALAFKKSSERYINGVLDLARKKPHLINFLQVQDQLEAVKTVPELLCEVEEEIIRHDIPVQTLLHPITSKIDHNYKWNVWDLKRWALLLADISKRRTHSTQTDESGSKGCIRLQTEEMVEKINQTKIDNYSNVPTLSNFIYGLRGRKDDKQFIITLTRPVEEGLDINKKCP